MPRVPSIPTLESESVRTAPLRIPLQSGKGVDASGLARGLTEAAAVTEKTQLQLSQIRLSEAETEVLKRWNARLYEDDDAYFKLVGKDAVDAMEPRMKELQEIQAEVSNNILTTGTERRIFNDGLSLRSLTTRQKMALKSWDERQNWDKKTATSSIQVHIETAVADPSPETLRLSKERIIEDAVTISRIDGDPPETQAQAAQVAVSGMYRAVIESMIPTSAIGAQALLNRYEDEIIAEDETALTKQLKEAVIVERSRIAADDIIAGGGTLEDQLAAARRIKDTEVRDATVRRINSTFNEDEAARVDSNRKLYNALGEDVLNGASVDTLRLSLPDAWSELTQSQREHLIALEAKRGKNITTKWGRWSQLVLMDRNELAQIHPMDERLNLADTEYKQLVTMIQEARSGDPGFAFTSIISPYQRLANAAGGAKKLDTPKGMLLTREFAERLETFEINKGSKASPTEIDSIISSLIVEVEIPSSFADVPIVNLFVPDRNVEVYQITLADVPEADQQKITDYYQRVYGRAPTENEMTDAYGLKLANDGQ